MAVLDRYLIREVLRATFAVTVVLLLLIASKLLMQQLGYVMEGKYSGNLVVTLLFNKLLTYFVHLLPFLMLLSAVLALGQLDRNSEVTALRACGYSELRMLMVLSALGLPLAIALGVMSLYLTPVLSHNAEVAHHQARLEAGISLSQGGRFVQTRDGRWALYASRTVEDAAHDVFFATYDEDKQRMHIETAKRVTQHFDEARQQYLLDFEQGRRYSGWPGDVDFQTVTFERHRLRMDAAVHEAALQALKYLTLGQLLKEKSAAAHGELQWRLSLPISLMLMLALAVLLARGAVRQGKYARVIYAIVIYLIYAQLQLLASSQVRSGNWPVWAGVWWVHVLMLSSIVGFYIARRRRHL